MQPLGDLASRATRHVGVQLVRAGRLLTGEELDVVVDGAVRIENGILTGVGRWADFGSEAVAVAVFPNGTLLPGLIDTHAHISLPADRRPYEDVAHDTDELMALVAVRNLDRHLRAGVTTIRDQGGRNHVTFSVREAINRGYIIGPRLLLAGRPLTQHRGHMYWCNGEADGRAEIRQTIRVLVAEGADHIKIVASGGGTAGTVPFRRSYTVDELRVAVEATHELDRLTAMHCRARTSIANALDAGADCVEHAEFLVANPVSKHGPSAAATGRIEYEPRLGERLASSGTFVSFTLQAFGLDTLRMLEARGPSMSSEERSELSSLSFYYDALVELLHHLRRDGVGPRLTISTDAGPFDTEFGRLTLGIKLAVSTGMTPQEAVKSVTCIAARCCGIEQLVGSIEVGKVADIVIVDGNPLEDIRRLDEVVAVFTRGVSLSLGPSPNPLPTPIGLSTAHIKSDSQTRTISEMGWSASLRSHPRPLGLRARPSRHAGEHASVGPGTRSSRRGTEPCAAAGGRQVQARDSHTRPIPEHLPIAEAIEGDDLGARQLVADRMTNAERQLGLYLRQRQKPVRPTLLSAGDGSRDRERGDVGANPP